MFLVILLLCRDNIMSREESIMTDMMTKTENMTAIFNLMPMLRIGVANKSLVEEVFYYSKRTLECFFMVEAVDAAPENEVLLGESVEDLKVRMSHMAQKAVIRMCRLNSLAKKAGEDDILTEYVNVTDFRLCLEIILEFQEQLLERTKRDLRTTTICRGMAFDD